MSQLLQVHMNQRLLKSKSGESSPGSPMLCPSPGNLSPLSPLSMGSPSSPQGMPIPSRRQISEPQHWIINQNGLLSSSAYSSQNGWNGLNMNMNFDPTLDSSMDAPFKMEDMDALSMEGELSKLSMAVDDDDIFKVERSDLLGPTLAELNAPDADAYLDGLTFDDLYWPAENSSAPPLEATPSPQTPCANSDPITLDPDGDFVPFQAVQPSSSFPVVNQKIIPAPGTSVPTGALPPNTILEYTIQQPTLTLTTDNVTNFVTSPSNNPAPPQPSSSNSGGLRELLLRRELQNSLESPDTSPLGQSLPRSISLSPGPSGARLSSSAPSGHNAWEQWQARREGVWQRRDPRPHLLSTGSLAEAGSTSSIADVLSPGRDFGSMDEGFDSDDVTDHDSSDEDTDNSDTESNAGSSARRERFFWQYNVQAKGPKGQRLVLTPTHEDPHVLQRPTDPVFSPLCHIQGIKHSGKARKGDGNDLTPNPRKLWQIGKELDRLNKVIAEMTPVADLPNAVKSRSRKEKNKLASRACRLKKKAQHEANKLKLYGLEQEHKRLIGAIEQSRQVIFSKMDGVQGPSDPLAESLAAQVERISKQGGITGPVGKIGGHTTEFVNKVLDKVKHGVLDGGINDI